ncbi:MAG: hypothetical protein U9O98_02660, partial [Asgard group archaeon]|nr:hypothetical protein [Asgard group archaeon]
MNRKKILTIFSILLLSPNIFFLSFNLSIPIIEFVTSQESQYYASFSAADEDYVNFSSMEGFTNGTSWSIVQRIKLPENPSVFGWSWFRGSAWEDREGDIALRLDTNEEHDYQITFWIQNGGWNSLRMDRSQNGLTLQNNTWYDIIVLFDRPSTTY